MSNYYSLAQIIPQYDKVELANYWMKAYDAGTTTPRALFTSADGDGAAAKFELDSEGFPVTSGDAKVVPFIGGGNFDIWLFPTAVEADNNDTSNAIRLADNLNASPFGDIGVLSFNNLVDTAAANVDGLELGVELDFVYYSSAQTINSGSKWKVIDLNAAATDNGIGDDGYLYLNVSGGFGVKCEIVSDAVNFKQFGAVADGIDIDIVPMRVCMAYAKSAKANVVGSQNDYHRIDEEFIVSHEVDWDGGMCQIFQETPDTNCVTFDKGGSGSGNYQNGVQARRIVAGTVAGTGNGFTFVNCNESDFGPLFVAGCGDIAFHNSGSLLSNFTHLEASNGLRITPPWQFLGESAVAHQTGLKHSSINGLAPNVNHYTRPSMTNSELVAFDIDTGVGNTFQSVDAEDIGAGATHLIFQSQNNLIGGNFEGDGSGIQIFGDNCQISGLNALTFLRLNSGVKGVGVRDSAIKYPIIDANTNNNVVENITITAGGSFVGRTAGTDNTVRNITDTDGSEIGLFKSGDFLPVIEFGGVDGASSYVTQTGRYWLDINRMYFSMFIQIGSKSAATGTATINLNDIPYASEAGVDFPCSWSGNGVPVDAGYGNIVTRVTAGSREVKLQKVLDTTGIATNLDNSDFGANDQVRISGWYGI